MSSNGKDPFYIEIYKLTGLRTKNLNLYQLAFKHKSKNLENNERLEFLGDSVLDAVISAIIYSNFPEKNEGELSKLRSKMVSRNMLNKLGNNLNLLSLISYRETQTQDGLDNTVGNALEALIGAIYLDKNLNYTEKFILNLWKEHITASAVTQIDAKTKLKEHSLKVFKILPNYKLISNTGPRHKPLFKVAVKLKDTKFFVAKGVSKKDAEQNAASLCLESVLKK